MSFNIANRLNNLSATTTSLLNDLSENYYTKADSDSNYYTKAQTDTAIATSDANFYTKAQTDTEIANLKNKRVVIKNDNDANDPFLVNNSANTTLFTVGKTGDIAATGSVSGTNILSTGSQGLQVKNGVSTVASINQAGAIVGTSCQINGVDVLTTAYNPFFCAGSVRADGTKSFDKGRVGFTSTRTSTGVYIITYASAYPNNNYIVSVCGIGNASLGDIGTNNTNTTKVEINIFAGGALSSQPFYFTVF